MRAKVIAIFLGLLLLLTGVSCAGEPPEGSVLYYSSQWGEKPTGADTVYRKLHIEATIQNVGGEGSFWVSAEIMEKELLMEGTGVQSKKVYMEQGEQQTYQFDFWLDPTQTSSFSVWCSDEPNEISSDLGSLRFLVLGEGDVVLWGAKVVSSAQPEGQMVGTGNTKADGMVVFSNIKAGEYTFYVSRYDYEQTEFNITVEAGLMTSMTVTLAEAATPSTTTYHTVPTEIEPGDGYLQ